VEDAFRKVNGVVDVTVGYCGGKTAEPTYGDVCSGHTGHTEAVAIEFDPAVVSFDQLLDRFFTLHDPTDNLIAYHGGQYKSVVFFTNDDQQKASQAAIDGLSRSGKLGYPIVTQVLPAPDKFWRAEEYHQQYYAKHYAKTCSR
jgi:peptide-methionine (S)-S-oxide reductase